ncbi:MAG TPA: DivIVA domain-containing protein [Mycobacteriales bacterium]|jgi:DivIVA domain-containing protein|nr:DivIVA domain-containing protein [Mycobacteriales bacterium]
MPLTPQDVRDKMFTSVRFKQGYDEDEVDAFLDRVEAELTRLLSENERLTGDLTEARANAAATADDRPEHPVSAPETPDPALTADVPKEPWAPKESAADVEAARPQPPAPAALEEPLPPPSPTEDALRRTLLLAQRTADAAIAEARAEAAAIMEDATTKAEQTERASRLEHATREHDHRVEFERLQSAVEQLRGFEREYRGRLKAYLHLQMRELEDSTPVEPTPVAGVPTRSALGAGPPAQETDEDMDFPVGPEFAPESGHFSHVEGNQQRDLSEPQ